MELINFFSWRPNISLKLHAQTTSQPCLYFVVQWVFALVSTIQPMNDWGLGLFLENPETFRVYFGYHNSLYIFAMPRF